MAGMGAVVRRLPHRAGKPALPAGVTVRLIADLAPYERNARTHSPAQLAKIAAIIEEFGWTNPVLISAEGQIIAGHGRVEAAKLLGLAEVPVLVLDHLSPAQRRAYVIADNKLAELAGWDDDLLASELQALSADGFDIDLTGFDASDLEKLLVAADPLPPDDAEDEVDEPEARVVSRRGDLWQLGAHRLLCGDSTLQADVERLLEGAKPHLMVTDPPYGVEYDAAWRNTRGLGGGDVDLAVGKVLNDDRADWSAAWMLSPAEVAYVWHAGLYAGTVQDSLQFAGFVVRSQIVWAKNNFAIGRGDYHWRHEPCWYAVRKGATGHWNGDRKQSTLWEIDKPQKSETGHSTQKPVECMRRPILNNSRRGDAIYEPFAGSGTTIIAAEGTQRRCYAMELSPQYVDLIVRRWQKFTRREAMLSDGRPFAELERERAEA